MADSSDAHLQLKKRARRRLVGAIALAGLAAIVLPMVMDSEPKQQIQEVQIRIPDQDNTPFNPKLSEPSVAPAVSAKSNDEEELKVEHAAPPVQAKPAAKAIEKPVDKPLEKKAEKSVEKKAAAKKPAAKKAVAKNVVAKKTATTTTARRRSAK